MRRTGAGRTPGRMSTRIAQEHVMSNEQEDISRSDTTAPAGAR